MNKIAKGIAVILTAGNVMLLIWLLVRSGNIAIFNPKGIIALQERNLIITEILLMLCMVIPVFILTFLIALKYKAGNKKTTYTPDWTGNNAVELTLWVIPSLLVLLLAFITWRATHVLDPYKPIASPAKPLTIQVVALNWKWLFIYPEQHIAAVNFVQFPQYTPLNFQLTADDAPMNSFWIPQLGGQIYAMTGMVTQHHLMANTLGEFTGSAAEINGKGFAGMRFTAKSTSQADFDAWVTFIKHSDAPLTWNVYNKLTKPSESNPVSFYSSVENDLYNKIIKK